MLTVLIHGFWGTPADWSDVIRRLPLQEELWLPGLFEPGPLAPHHGLREWTRHFLDEIDDRSGGQPVQAVGYSMGGRLLAGALLQKPQAFARALVLSAQPFSTVEGREGRQNWELDWREKFLTQPWERLEHEWNGQDVFTGSRQNSRPQSPILREMLGQALVNWSPLHHRHSREDVKSLPNRVDWAFGALDQKYRDIAKDLANLEVQGQITVIENAGHRLPWDAAQWIANWIKQG